MPWVNQDPFLSFEMVEHFYKEKDWDTVCLLVFLTIRNAQPCLGNLELEDIQEDLQALLTRLYDICFDLSMKLIEAKQLDESGRATIGALLSAIPEAHHRYKEAEAYLKFGNLEALENVTSSASFELKEKKRIAFLKTAYDAAAKLGDDASELTSSALGNALENGNATPTIWKTRSITCSISPETKANCST